MRRVGRQHPRLLLAGHDSPRLLLTIGLSYADSSSTAHQIEGDPVVDTAGTAALTHPHVCKICSVFTR